LPVFSSWAAIPLSWSPEWIFENPLFCRTHTCYTCLNQKFRAKFNKPGPAGVARTPHNSTH
jgi:hypothetical protein